MELLFLFCILLGATLFGWGIGRDVPAATLSGLALLIVGVLASLGLRLRPALVVSVAAVTFVLAAVVTLSRTGPAGEGPTAAATAVPSTATVLAGTPGQVTPHAGENLAAFGQRLATANACFACHSTDGSRSTGPTWRDLPARRNGSRVAGR